MSHSVDRLKELLFESETRALSDIQQRLAASETNATRDRAAVADRLDAVFARAGTDDRFGAAVANVLDSALRKAEVERHQALSDAVAPLIVRTIKIEILNSRDELVEALYPMTGRMVKAYVASAVADLMANINRSVESNPVMLRLRSLTTGKSVAELAFADANRPRFTELFLIRRGTGELVARWPNEGGSNHDHAMSGVLAAINEFASETFKDGGSALRQIDIGDARVYLRASPLHLLAAKCTGSAPIAADSEIDSAFLSAIEHFQADNGAQDKNSQASSDAAQLVRLSSELNDRLESTTKRGISPVVLIGLLIGLIAAGLIGWFALERYYVSTAYQRAGEVLSGTETVRGYPIGVSVDDWARRVTLTGLAPDEAAKTAIVAAMRHRLPGSEIREHLAVLPGAHGEIGNAVERASIEAALTQARLHLEQASSDLNKLVAGNDVSHQDANRILQVISAAVRDFANRSGTLWTKPDRQQALISDLDAAVERLSGSNTVKVKSQSDSGRGDNIERARQLAASADRLASVVAAAVQAAAVKRSIPKQEPAIVRAPDITAFQRLAVFVRSHAIFFSDGTIYRDEARANAVLDALSKLMGETDAYLRLVGYTDGQGASARNDTISAGRAQLVAEALIARGVPAERLIHVGRLNSNPITTETGATSSNRRVEFEIGFDGERQP